MSVAELAEAFLWYGHANQSLLPEQAMRNGDYVQLELTGYNVSLLGEPGAESDSSKTQYEQN